MCDVSTKLHRRLFSLGGASRKVLKTYAFEAFASLCQTQCVSQDSSGDVVRSAVGGEEGSAAAALQRSAAAAPARAARASADTSSRRTLAAIIHFLFEDNTMP